MGNIIYKYLVGFNVVVVIPKFMKARQLVQKL